MSCNWPRFTIQELIDSQVITVQKDGNHGSNYPRASEFGDKGVAFLTAKLLDDAGNIDFAQAPRLSEEKAAKFKFGFIEKDDVLLSHNATVGRVAIVPNYGEKVLIGTSLTHYRLNSEKLLPQYLAVFFTSKDFQNQLAAVMSQTTRNQVPITAQRKLEVVVPPIKTQKQLTRISGSIIEKISLNTQTNQTLEEMTQAIFKSWFVDFEPVKAIMNGEQPEGMDTATASLFPEKLVDTEVGELPEGWKLASVGELLDKTIGGDWGKEEPDEKHTEEVRIVRGTDIPKLHGGAIESVPVRYVESKKLKTRKLERGDIVIEVSGGSKDQPTGRSLFISDNILKRLKLPSEPASFCRRFKPKSYEIGLLLAVHFQLMYQAGKTWEYQNQSTGISNFQTKYFLEAEHIVIPSDDVLKAFVKQVSPMMEMIHSNQNIELAKLRDTLLPKLLSGEIELGSSEELVEAI